MADLLERLQRALTSRYLIERELGRGGMATVYLARDLKHDSLVAIKVLDAEVTSAIGPERFLREVKTIAQLTHPHILPLHDSGVGDGLLFYVMPYVEGESLRMRLEREKQLPVDDALQITREVAAALSYAHGKGKIHRDIKPENILLQSGHAVVADFGIARAIEHAGGETLTGDGVAIGTPAYMSPEQAAGSRDLDPRSDLYALGCVLYEMLAGQPPFSGPPESLVYQHLSLVPRPVTELRPSVPPGVGAALARALAKAPADRFASLARFAEALAASTEVAPATRPGSPRRRRRAAVAWVTALALAAIVVWTRWDSILALFPPGPAPATRKEWVMVAEFDGPPDDPGLAGAVRDMVSAALDQSAIVATVPEDQIRLGLEMAGKPPEARVDAPLARELAYRRAIRAVVEGRVSRLGGGYSVVVRVVDADSGRVVAAVSEAAHSDDELIPTMDRVGRRLRDALGEHKEDLRATRELLVEEMTPSFEAYKRLVRARELLFGVDNRGAIIMARSALSFDPDCAVAWGIMAFAFYNLGEPDSALGALNEALRRPGRLDEIDRLMHLALVADLRGDVQAEIATLDQILQHDPTFGPAHINRGYLLLRLGRPEESLASSRRANEFSPFGPSQVTLFNQFNALLWLGQLDEAREVARRMKGGLAENAPAQIAVAAGDWAAAESLGKALERLPEAAAGDRVGASPLAVALAARGRVDAAVQSFQREQHAAAEERRRVDVEHAKRGRLLLGLVSGRLNGVPEDVASSDTTTLALVTQGLWEAAAGDTGRARRLLARIRARPVIERNRQGSNPVLIEAWLAARAGRFAETVRILGPAALQGDDIGSVLSSSNRVLKRWLVAQAYEGLGRPDSAAAYFTLAMSPIGDPEALRDARIAYSYAHRRLVLLYARMGRLEEARRHWEVFSATFTGPDPEMLPLIEEARAALASAEAMAKSTGR